MGAMGKGGEGKGAVDADVDGTDNVDAHTIFVRGLPFLLTDSQLEDVFSEVGPVRHCFTVKEKGSDHNRGFGFVQFAVTEDAHRAVVEKNGALLQGRKIKVEVAKRRAPLDVRHPKSDILKLESSTPVEQLPSGDSPEKDSKKRKSSKLENAPQAKKRTGEQLESSKTTKPDDELQIAATEDQGDGERKEAKKKNAKGDKRKPELKSKQEVDDSHGSTKQRPARTVVVGGLESSDMLDAVLAEAKKAGPIETVQRSFTELEMNSRGLAKDGCKPKAAAIVFVSVKGARQAVAMLHQKTISGGLVWARQLGGEGSKLKQLRLIVRNLPFQVSEATLQELFSPAGFVWEVTIPRKPDGLSKGFAFIGFTSKADAEKAVKAVNGKLIANRPIAVDWAVGKKQYEAAVAPAAPSTPAVAPDIDLDESESTASESEADGKESRSDDEVESDMPPPKRETDFPSRERVASGKRSNGKLGEEKPSQEEPTSKKRKGANGNLIKSASVTHGDDDTYVEMERTEEIDMMKKILTKVVTSVADNVNDDEHNIVEGPTGERPSKDRLTSVETADEVPANKKAADKGSKVESTELTQNYEDDEKGKLSRTVFIRNLPAGAKVPELRKLFSEFGDIKSFRLVLCPITKRSKGNAFLEYVKPEAAHVAVASGAKNGPDDMGLMLKGRAVSVSMAVDKNSARKLAKETFHKQVEQDKRNLALAKEGKLVEGTPSAEGVSKKDMAKRQQLEHEKATKLRSPNFHVSKTRLLVHNIPKTMTEKELKKLFIDGVKSRASKQNPTVKQVKILKDEQSQKSRGAAFIEFTEHQHALVALRVLNNNPATFSAESRPIVEFAIENSLILRKRAANANQAKGQGGKRTQGQKSTVGSKEGDKKRKDTKQNNQRTKPGDKTAAVPGEDASKSEQEQKEPRVKDRKRKRGKDGRQGSKVLKEKPSAGTEADATTAKDDKPDESPAGGKQELRRGRQMKKSKTNDTNSKAIQSRRASNGMTEGGTRNRSDVAQPRSPKKSDRKGSKKQAAQLSERQQSGAHENHKQQKVPPKEHKLKKYEQPQSTRSSQKTELGKKGRQRGKGRDVEDKLDTLVAEYRRKYFSGGSQATALKSVAAGSGDLRRWFQ